MCYVEKAGWHQPGSQELSKSCSSYHLQENEVLLALCVNATEVGWHFAVVLKYWVDWYFVLLVDQHHDQSIIST